MPTRIPPLTLSPFELAQVAAACAKAREGGMLPRDEHNALERVIAKIDNLNRAMKARETHAAG